MKKSYNFLFYCFYALDRVFGRPWWSEYKAALAVSLINVWVLITFFGYIELLFDVSIIFSENNNNIFKIFICIVLLINWILFIRNNRFKKIIKEFDIKERKGLNTKRYVWFVLFLIATILMMILMFFLTAKKYGNL